MPDRRRRRLWSATVRRPSSRATTTRRRRRASTSPSSAPDTPDCGRRCRCSRPTRRCASSSSNGGASGSAPAVATAAGARRCSRSASLPSPTPRPRRRRSPAAGDVRHRRPRSVGSPPRRRPATTRIPQGRDGHAGPRRRSSYGRLESTVAEPRRFGFGEDDVAPARRAAMRRRLCRGRPGPRRDVHAALRRRPPAAARRTRSPPPPSGRGARIAEGVDVVDVEPRRLVTRPPGRSGPTSSCWRPRPTPRRCPAAGATCCRSTR